jgi:Flp pilus assembly pilin Flp
MIQLWLWFEALLGAAYGAIVRLSGAPAGSRRRCVRGEEGQTTAEYALVILAAAAIAVVLIVWARSSGKLPAFFDKIIDSITDSGTNSGQ